MTIYTFTYWEGNSRLFMIKWLVIMLIASIFVLGLYLLVNSISFRLQRGSRLKDLFESFFIVFGAYPPDIFLRDKLLFILISCIGLYPAVFLPYRMIVGPASIENWILLIVLSFAMFAL
ncbi:MAG: hypothetical protein LBD11_06675 [Candidatus Peribacteria bacterium]|nr:hypothetical protein [Candidatus Peribacteria bacterium]